jgi:hypothetical protein
MGGTEINASAQIGDWLISDPASIISEIERFRGWPSGAADASHVNHTEDDAIISSSWFESLGMNVDLALVDNSHTGPSETMLSMNGDSEFTPGPLWPTSQLEDFEVAVALPGM